MLPSLHGLGRVGFGSPGCKPITIRQIAGHTAGIPHTPPAKKVTARATYFRCFAANVAWSVCGQHLAVGVTKGNNTHKNLSREAATGPNMGSFFSEKV